MSALQAAVRGGHVNVVAFLLADKNVHVNVGSTYVDVCMRCSTHGVCRSLGVVALGACCCAGLRHANAARGSLRQF